MSKWKRNNDCNYWTTYVKGEIELCHYHTGPLKGWKLYYNPAHYHTLPYLIRVDVAQEWADKVIHYYELEGRVGTRVQEDDRFPAGSEFINRGHGYPGLNAKLRLDWKDGKANLYFWDDPREGYWWKNHKPVADPNLIKLSYLFTSGIEDLEITKIGSGVEIYENYSKIKETTMSDQVVTTTKENILKTHAEGCSDVKKALESLYPEVFKKEEVPVGLIKGKAFVGLDDDGDYLLFNMKGEIQNSELYDETYFLHNSKEDIKQLIKQIKQLTED